MHEGTGDGRTGPASSSADDRAIRVLHVDDEPAVTGLTATVLERVDGDLTVETATSVEQGLERLRREPFDCIVSDYVMDGRDGLAFLRAVRGRGSELPFILYTGRGSEEVASEAIAAGVTDYLQKTTGQEQYELLANRIRLAVEERRARRRLDERTRELETLVDNLPGMVYRCANEPEWPFEKVGGDVESLSGYTNTELLDGTVSWGADVIHPDDRERVWWTVQDALVAGERFEVNYRIHTANGELRWMWERGRGVSVTDGAGAEGGSEGGDVAGDEADRGAGERTLEGFITDVTEERERERELEEVKRLYETVVEGSRDGIRIVQDGRVTFVNDRFATMTGYDQEALVGAPLDEVVAPEHAERIAGHHRGRHAAYGEAPEVYEVDVVTRDGERRRVEVAASRIRHGGRPASLSIWRDITERREREIELERYRAFVEHSPTMFTLLDGSGRVRFDTTGQHLPWRHGPEDFVGEHVFEYIHPEDRDRVVEAFADLVTGEEDQATLAYRFRTVDGRWRWLRSIAIDRLDDPLIGAVAVSSVDVTEAKERERALERRNERLEEFAGVVSHDLRNPLQVVDGRVNLARLERDDEHLAAAAVAVDRMKRLIDDLLMFARTGFDIEATEPVDLAATARSCWDGIATGGATLLVEVDRTIQCDEGMLRQLLENLLLNAIEHGGEDVTVTVGDLADGSGFYVEDDGVGFPPGSHDRVFEGGYSTSERGTGFGLRIVRNVAEVHGWSVEAASGKEGGALIEVRGVRSVDGEDERP